MAGSRLDRLSARRIDASVKTRQLQEVYKRISEDDAVKYVVGAMQPIDPEYTKNSLAEGERVREQLKAGLDIRHIGADFRYQGSVTNDTHIRAHSDVDILVLTAKYWTLEPPQVVDPLYAGDPIADLKELRTASIAILKAAYPAATVDDSGSKCVAVSGGSLRRRVEAIPSNWWHTVEYAQYATEVFRGVQILDLKGPSRLANKPFLHNARIEQRDRETGGNLRRVVRLLKSVKYDSERSVALSSYDVTALAYRMPDTYLAAESDQPLLLLKNANQFLQFVAANGTYRAGLKVPNAMRAIFGSGGATEAGLSDLIRETSALQSEVEQGLTRSFKKLADARIRY